MDIDAARNIYVHPKGYIKEELGECLDILNATSQPIKLSDIQFEAIADAHRRLEQLNRKKVISNDCPK